jgi:4-amino-4-deoxy-L-arabinose transferase-like glycosyltransferase
MGRREFRIGLAAALGLALLARLLVIVSPLGEIDADEAIVGLMARHIAFSGERPVFYWGQPYLGSLEAFTAAPLFRLFDSSTFLLKLVPTAYSLGFLALSAVMARRFFGTRAGLATAAYLAVPPAMWAVWSTKARGGYAELLFLGQAVLFVTLLLAARRSPKLALLWGLLAGLTFWTHLLGIVYLLPAGLFLILGRRRNWSLAELGLIVLGSSLGMSPLLIENVANGFLTVAALLQPPDVPLDIVAQFLRFFRVGIPVLLGLGQPTTSEALYDLDWLHRPAGNVLLVGLVLMLLAGVVAMHLRALRRLVACGADRLSEPALLVLLAMVVPPLIAVTRFGFFVSEPRYALPLYGTVPLLMGALWRIPARIPRIEAARWGVVALLLGFNVWSVLSTDVRLWRPEDTPDSTAATRAELVQYVVAQDRHQLYTDYWIGYPIMFETRETVLAYVISGGFNRYVPPADNVQRTPNPAWVFTAGMDAERIFREQLAAVGGTARQAEVAVYRVYTEVQPLDALRPPGVQSSGTPTPPP